MIPRPVDIAWAAGLFEGEGCITKQPGRPHQPRLQLASTDKDVVERFARIMGRGSVALLRRGPDRLTDNPKPLWAWACVSGAAIAPLKLMLPYFGERRTAKALEVIELRERHIAEATGPRQCGHCSRVFRPSWHSSSHRVRYCSSRCQIDAQNERGRLSRIHPPRLCVTCGESFVPNTGTKIHCSKRCRDRLGKTRMKQRRAAYASH